MNAQEKTEIYNLFKTAYTCYSGYVTPQFSGEINFSDDLFNTNVNENEQKNTPETVLKTIDKINNEIAQCRKCALVEKRRNSVPGQGVENPLVMIIGEGPGEEEDRQGLPFVGPAGQLLDKMLSSIQLNRFKNCYIANIVKCRPPFNRNPEDIEAQACRHFLDSQIDALKPKMILLMGKVAANNILETQDSLSKIRGKFYKYRGIPVFATYHPSALLRNPELKRPAWEDLKIFKSILEQIAPEYGL